MALLVDNESYFAALASALRRAQRSVLLLGWEFDPRTRLTPGGERIGDLLVGLAARRPALDIRVLAWDMALPIAAGRGRYRGRAFDCFRGSTVRLSFDHAHPAGACHHQKLVVIDDAVAFCSGGDLAGDRWDSAAHRDHDDRRRGRSGRRHAPRHEVTLAVDGDAAAALGGLARERWARANGEVPAAPATRFRDRWPEGVPAVFESCAVAIARTAPPYEGEPAIRENEALYLAGIAAARRLIYLENQYFTSPVIGDALKARLAERHGPEIVVVLPRFSPSYFDRLVMDRPRDRLIERLRAADRHGRFHAYTPVTARGENILVHAKLMIVDDRLLRVGSANLNNRSMGLDTECDLAVDAALAGAERASRVRNAIRRSLYRLAGHYFERAPEEVASAVDRTGSLAAAVHRLARAGANRLQPLGTGEPAPGRSLIADFHLGDPQEPADVFRPWRRRAGA